MVAKVTLFEFGIKNSLPFLGKFQNVENGTTSKPQNVKLDRVT